MNWTETRARLIDCGVDAARLPEQLPRGANLRFANLWGADLRGADLRDANLRDADLTQIQINHLTIGVHTAPQGDLIGWGEKSGHVVKMLIPADARRSCATTRKHRAEYVTTLEIDDGALTRLEHRTEHGATIYGVGEITRANGWDEDRWTECSAGIHFFLTREEAEAWTE